MTYIISSSVPKIITSNIGLAANTEYVISSAVSSTLTLSVPLAGGGYTPAIGDTIKIRNTTDNDIIISRYTTGTTSQNPLRYWNGDVVPSSGTLNRYKELTIEGKGEITLINQDGGGTLVDWWVHHSPAVEWEVDSIGTNGSLYYDADKRAVTILGTFDPPLKQVTGNLSGGLQNYTYFVEHEDSNNYTISLPSRHNEETIVQNLTNNGPLYIENRGTGTITLALVTAYIYVNPNTYRAYLQEYDGTNITSNTLTINQGETYVVETVLDPNPAVPFVYYRTKLIAGQSIPTASTDLTDTADLIRTTDTASTTAAGVVEIADNTETATGTSTALAVSPAGLANKLNSYATTASLAAVATSGAYGDLSGTPTTSDDFTANHTGVNYTGATTTDTITTHLSAIDTALGSVGGGGYIYSAITANTTAQAGYHYSCTGSFTLTLPTTGINSGEEIRVKNMGTGTITIDPQTQTIDGSTTDYILGIQYSAITFVSTGSNWEII